LKKKLNTIHARDDPDTDLAGYLAGQIYGFLENRIPKIRPSWISDIHSSGSYKIVFFHLLDPDPGGL